MREKAKWNKTPAGMRPAQPRNLPAIEGSPMASMRLCEELLAVEEDRVRGQVGCSLDELDAYLDDVIAEA